MHHQVANLVQVLLNLLQQETLASASSSVSHILMQPWAVHLGSNSLNGHMDFAVHVNCAQRRCSNNSLRFEQRVVTILVFREKVPIVTATVGGVDVAR